MKLRNLCIDRRLLLRILYCGIPTAIQSSIFSIANVVLASGLGTLPVESISANTIASNIDAITYQCMNGFSTSLMTFAGQNYGAMKKDRLWKSFAYAIIQVTVIGVAVAQVQLLFAEEIAGMFIAAGTVNREVVISETRSVMEVVLTPYFLCGIMGVMAAFLRAIGFSVWPMLVTLLTVLPVRLVWMYVFFPMYPTSIGWLYMCFPISWAIAILIDIPVLIYGALKIKKISAAAAQSSGNNAAAVKA